MQRGEIFSLEGIGALENMSVDQRFVVILQSDAMLPRSSVLVAPTSFIAQNASFRPEVVIGAKNAKVLVEQVAVIDVQMLRNSVGTVTMEELWSIDEALAVVFGLP